MLVVQGVRPARGGQGRLFRYMTCTLAALLVLSLSPAVAIASVGSPEPSQPTDGSYELSRLAFTPAVDDDALKVVETATLVGFGGSYIDSSTDTLYLWTTRPEGFDAQRAITAITGVAEYISLNGADAQLSVIVRKADYTFAELKDWHDKLVPLFRHDDVVWTSIDERQNRLTVAVRNPQEMADSFLVRSRRLGVPDGAIRFVREEGIDLELTEYRRPLVGGLGIMYDLLELLECSIGFNWNATGLGNGFVTNSHCSPSPYGGGQGTVYSQPRIDIDHPEYLVGEVVRDPAAFSCNIGGSDLLCRFSDAAFTNIGETPNVQGQIARVPLGLPSWNGTDIFRITSTELGSPLPGLVRKVGRTTGLTIGEVVEPCVNVRREVAGIPYVLVCQYGATYASDPGDSGSPVFRLTHEPQPGDVQLEGIHWGRGRTSQLAFFSTFQNIAAELVGSPSVAADAPVTGVCAPGFDC